MTERTPDGEATPDDHPDDYGVADEPGMSQLAPAARRAFATLLTNRFITRTTHRAAWDAILAYENEIRERLADMYQFLVLDQDYQTAFKRQDPDEDAPKLLRRDKPLSRDASLLLIHLRKEHMYTDATDDPVVITRDQVAEFLRPFRSDGDGDEAKLDRRVDAAIRAVSELKLMTVDPDADYLFTVSPAVVPLIGADEMLRMERYFVEVTPTTGVSDTTGTDESGEDPT